MNVGLRLGGICAVSALVLLGCGSSDGGGGSGTGGGGGAAGALLAPTITMVMPMAPAGLHVTWTNNQTDCDTVEGERKSPSADWASVFSVPGYVDNKHDGTMTDKLEYTYRVRCHRGAEYSPYSNEMSGTPP